MNNTSTSAITPQEATTSSSRQFHLYVKQWKESIDNPEKVTCPSSLPPFTPIPLIADVKVPKPFSPLPSSESKPQIDAVPRQTGIVYSTLMSKHAPNDPNDYERPARTEKTVEHLTAVGLIDSCVPLKARKARTKELRLVHTQEHIDYIDQIGFFAGLENKGASTIGQDLYACEDTSDVARLACGCAAEAAIAVARKATRNAYAVVRPPGHHAGAGAPSGFCFFNNVAVAARAAQKELQLLHPERYQDKAPRVVILDWDVHHCDGTESIFADDPSVLVISIHQYSSGRGHVLRKLPALNEIQRETKETEMSAEELTNLVLGDDSAPGNTEPVDPLPRAKRARKEVDYNTLAKELGDELADDAAAARALGVASPGTLQSSSSTSRSTAESFTEPNQRRLVGDTDGVSADEDSINSEDELFYPQTGHMTNIGGENNPKAKGRNINIPCPATGMGDLEYLQVMHEIVLPCSREHEPDIFFISCGFDSAQGDLLGSMSLTPTGYYAMTKLLTKEFGAIVAVLEGGYHVSNVARCSEAVLRALLEASGARIPTRTRMLWFQMQGTVKKVKRLLHPHWKCLGNTEE